MTNPSKNRYPQPHNIFKHTSDRDAAYRLHHALKRGSNNAGRFFYRLKVGANEESGQRPIDNNSQLNRWSFSDQMYTDEKIEEICRLIADKYPGEPDEIMESVIQEDGKFLKSIKFVDGQVKALIGERYLSNMFDWVAEKGIWKMKYLLHREPPGRDFIESVNGTLTAKRIGTRVNVKSIRGNTELDSLVLFEDRHLIVGEAKSGKDSVCLGDIKSKNRKVKTLWEGPVSFALGVAYNNEFLETDDYDVLVANGGHVIRFPISFEEIKELAEKTETRIYN